MLGRVRGRAEGTRPPLPPSLGPGEEAAVQGSGANRGRASLAARTEEGAMGPLASRASRSWRSGP